MFGEVRGGSTQPRGSQKRYSFSDRDRKQRLQGERHSVLIYFRRTWGNDVLCHSGRLRRFELCRIVLYTLHSCVLGSHCVDSPAGSMRIYKKASLYLGRKEAQQCRKDVLADWNSLFRTIKRQPWVLWGNRRKVRTVWSCS